MMGAVVTDAEERLARRRHDAAEAKVNLARALEDLQRAQSDLLSSKLDAAITMQRSVEEEAVNITKDVNTLYHRAAKWNAEQKRFRVSLAGLADFTPWALGVESELLGIAGNLEYVYAVFERESAERAASNGQA